jgi:hypothetical protein
MKKLISLVLIMSLLFSQPASATVFSDVLGLLFTVATYPIQLILGSTKAPFFVAQNPFVEKDWHKEEKKKVIHIIEAKPIDETPDINPQAKPATPTPPPLKPKEEVIFQHEDLRGMHLRLHDMPIEQQQQLALAWRVFFGGNVVGQEQQDAAAMWNMFAFLNMIPFSTIFFYVSNKLAEIFLSTHPYYQIAIATAITCLDFLNRNYQVFDEEKSWWHNLRISFGVVIDIGLSKSVVKCVYQFTSNYLNPFNLFTRFYIPEIWEAAYRLTTPNVLPRCNKEKKRNGFFTFENVVINPVVKFCRWLNNAVNSLYDDDDGTIKLDV